MNSAINTFENRPIAFFSAEYALEPNLPIYAGGLGILANDYLHEADDQHLPVVGVGLLYDVQNSPKFQHVFNEHETPLKIQIPIADRNVTAQVWKYMVGSIPVYLLDSDVEGNDPADRLITHKLYVEDKETRLKQELIIGIGGLRMLEALKIHPLVYHLNEGHSAFIALELIRHEMQERKVGFLEAITFAQKRIVFTNHTLVAAGHEFYSNDLVALMLTGYAQELGVPVLDVVELGLVQDSSTFSMTILSMRMAGKINAVSKLHAAEAAKIWTDHPMIPITNGIHIPTWDMVKNLKNHDSRKQELLTYISQHTHVNWKPNELLIGWARRFVAYKRPLALFEHVDQLLQITKNAQFPVKIVISGKPHESDENGNALVQQLLTMIQGPLKDTVVFLPDYTTDLARTLVSGCDVWLNTPIVGFEACGTSGMKAALNGVLPCSTSDGWFDEIDLGAIGWKLDSDHIGKDLLSVIGQDIVPMYYTRQAEWQERMKKGRDLILSTFSTTNMLKEYAEQLYV